MIILIELFFIGWHVFLDNRELNFKAIGNNKNLYNILNTIKHVMMNFWLYLHWRLKLRSFFQEIIHLKRNKIALLSCLEIHSARIKKMSSREFIFHDTKLSHLLHSFIFSELRNLRQPRNSSLLFPLPTQEIQSISN